MIPVPEFPDYRRIELADKTLFDRQFERMQPDISEYTFTNLFGWRNFYGFRLSGYQDFLVLTARWKGKEVFYPLIGHGDTSATMLDLMRATGNAFVRVPEHIKQLFEGTHGVKTMFDPDNADYEYLTDDLVKLQGRKYDGKRNLIRKFKSSYAYEYFAIGTQHIAECFRFEDFWCHEMDCEKMESLKAERLAMEDILHNYGALGVRGGAIRVNGAICAVCMAEKLNRDTLVIHILKAAREMPGLYQTIFNEFLQHEAADAVTVNMEQDLGIEGLRKAKLSYQPSDMVKKYTLSLAA
ncbi:MAG TPA: phosphatidylglycerol lysyltransferase domain-containing protein [Candidatus Omnitrophota bacterium]|nr:phosphatidylglycerol lysyltransferase domain-containing protein [Candidatus Omnitrophota bacterium]HRZ14355.1 phosphatidylglycerol lysyltransferase domain-containing protein [Candidatus Omnitrophota bacterium]